MDQAEHAFRKNIGNASNRLGQNGSCCYTPDLYWIFKKNKEEWIGTEVHDNRGSGAGLRHSGQDFGELAQLGQGAGLPQARRQGAVENIRRGGLGRSGPGADGWFPELIFVQALDREFFHVRTEVRVPFRLGYPSVAHQFFDRLQGLAAYRQPAAEDLPQSLKSSHSKLLEPQLIWNPVQDNSLSATFFRCNHNFFLTRQLIYEICYNIITDWMSQTSMAGTLIHRSDYVAPNITIQNLVGTGQRTRIAHHLQTPNLRRTFDQVILSFSIWVQVSRNFANSFFFRV